MDDHDSSRSSNSMATVIGGPADRLTVLHWYDFICPFCYVAQARNRLLAERGFALTDLAFEIHPEIPPRGQYVGPRSGKMYANLEIEADKAGLPLHWPERMPNSRMALAAAEWVRRNQPDMFGNFAQSLFAAHFADRADIGSQDVVEDRARESCVRVEDMVRALADKSAFAFVGETELLGRREGVQSTPSWLIGGRIVAGLLSNDVFIQVADKAKSDPDYGVSDDGRGR
ncbi:DsbA family oxidoreductase [Phyllobacterium endophyticum]|uniref:DsbA family oxidoreductase n=1 Tax=Phyllobacterium endophyticum TaxID=1149773 RepID=UPI0011C7659A|nr:DsbA family protein [Phyllobacterium endophyticum]TXR46497.1 hypothetical protein FVA77_24715 [Phyllobacterium endophyticum]